MGERDDPPPPGSDEALRLGCQCPVIDNRRGKGVVIDGQPVWWVNGGCPMHGQGANEGEVEGRGG